MCGIAGAVSLARQPVPRLDRALATMSELIAHRGPDGLGYWQSPRGDCGLAHRRLAIIDLSASARQPMSTDDGVVITYNGEIYNYIELATELGRHWTFRTSSD